MESVAADVADAADRSLVLFDEGAARDALDAAAADHDVVDLAENAGFDDFLDLLHVFAIARLEPDRYKVARFLFGGTDRLCLFEGDAHGLFEQDVLTGVQGADGRTGVLAVVGADGNGVDVVSGAQLLMGFVGGGVGPAEFVEEFARLTGDDVRARDDLHVRELLIGIGMCVCDTAGTDDTDSQFILHFPILLYGTMEVEIRLPLRYYTTDSCGMLWVWGNFL